MKKHNLVIVSPKAYEWLEKNMPELLAENEKRTLGLDLKDLEDRLDNALSKETKESIMAWLDKLRQREAIVEMMQADEKDGLYDK